MSRIFWDTSLFVYLIEHRVGTGDRVLSLRKRMIERQDRSIRPPDAIQLACASAARVDLFITNDERLSRRVVPGIHFIQSLATATI